MARLLAVIAPLLCLLPALGVEERSAQEVRESFTMSRAVVTGTVEGLTEFLPVSSTGHMIISDRLLAVPISDTITVTGVVDHKNRPVSLKRVADDYIVIIQIGAIAAVLVVFYTRIRNLLVGIFTLQPAALRLSGRILLAFIPAAVLGLLFKDAIEEYFFSIEIVACALIAGGLAILIAERYLPKQAATAGEVDALTTPQALLVGACQCVALIPGTSRSLATILGGRLAGLSNAAATEFSFLVGLVILSAASLYKMWSLGPALRQVYPAEPAVVGLLVAAATAFIAVKWMVGLVSRRGLGPFAWYRILLGLAILSACALK